MRKSLLVIAFGLLSAQAALAGDSTKTAVGGGVGGALGNVVGGSLLRRLNPPLPTTQRPGRMVRPLCERPYFPPD